MYRKFTADLIFDGYQFLPANNVLITDVTGVIVDIVPLKNAGDDIQTFNGILCPGFINAHCHLELSHMKGQISTNIGLTAFILKVVFERSANVAELLTAIEQAEADMLNSGIVAVGDICNNTITIHQKRKNKLYYHNFIESSGFTAAVAPARFDSSLQTYHQFSAISKANSLVPHAPYSISPELFSLLNKFTDNAIISIHNQETAAENELFDKKEGDFLAMYATMNIDITDFKPSGKTSLQTYLPWLTQRKSLILVHNICSSEADIDFEKLQTSNLPPFIPSATLNNQFQITNLQQPATYYCLCANANLYITGKLPNVPLLIDQQCKIVLGTDSLASNHQLNMLAEIKTLQQHFSQVPLQTMLQWATINGAVALQINDVFGSFEKGKKPGLVHIDHIHDLKLTAATSSKRVL